MTDLFQVRAIAGIRRATIRPRELIVIGEPHAFFVLPGSPFEAARDLSFDH